MARARLIKPGFFTNDDLAEVALAGRLLFVGLWTISDREGRLEDRPKRIKAEVMPFDNVSVDRLLTDLAKRGFIVRYESGGQRLIQVVSFARHQSPHPKEPASHLPAMGEPMTSPLQDSVETGSSPAVAVAGSSVAVAVAVADPAAAGAPVDAATPDEVSEGDVDVGFRERYGSLITALGSTPSRSDCDAFTQIAEDYDLEAIQRAIRECMAANERCWPTNVRKRLLAAEGGKVDNRSFIERMDGHWEYTHEGIRAGIADRELEDERIARAAQ